MSVRIGSADETTSKLVAHFKNGQVFKGFSRDWAPGRESFHLVQREGKIAASREIHLADLKALFHVKTWGRKDRHRDAKPGFPEKVRSRPRSVGRAAIKTVLEFFDGEKIFGYSVDYDPNRPGFYLLPANPRDNNRKIYVVNSSLVNIQFVRE